MSRDDELQDQLRRLACAEPRQAGPAVEGELRGRFRAMHRRKQRRWALVAELAALLVLAVGLFWALKHDRGKPGIANAPRLPNEFIELPYAQSGVPMEQAIVVRMTIPASELSGMGLPLGMASGGGQVSADLLVGQDGVARAVRLVQ